MNITQKLFGIVLTLMLFISAVPFVNAGNVSLYAYWVGANAQSLTVTQGAIPQIMITADSLAPNFNLVVDLYKGTQKINTLLKVDNLTQDSYTKAISLNTAYLEGDYTIQAKITSYNSSDIETLTLHVNKPEEIIPPPPQNHAPVLNPIGDHYIPVGKTLQFTLSATDADNDKLYFGAVSLQPNMKLNSGSGKFTWTPAKTGTYSITFTVTDGQAEDSETIQIYVLDAEKPDTPPSEPKNTAPQMNNIPALHVNEGDTINYVVSGTDAEKDQLTYYVHTLAANGVPVDNNLFPNLVPEGAHFDAHTGVFTFSPDYTFIKHPQTQKTLQVRFKAYDGKLFSDWKTVTILVSDVNREPHFVTSSDQLIVYAGETVSLDLYATDADVEDNLHYSVENAPASATVSGTHFSWKTDLHDLGSHNLTFTVTDGFAIDKFDTQIIVQQKPAEPKTQCSDGKDNDGDNLIDLADPGCSNPEDDDETNVPPPPPIDPNSTPVIGSVHTQFGTEGKLLQFTVTIFDKNGDKITLTPYSADPILPDLASINGQGVNIIDNQNGTFTVQLQPLYSFVKHPQTSRSFTLILQADDGKAKTSKNVLVIIKDVNQEPQFKPLADQTVYVGDKVSFAVEATDADNDTLNYAAVNVPTGATYTKSGFSWKPTKEQVGLHTVTFTVNDGFTTVSEDVLISVLLKGDTLPPPPPPTTQCSDGKDNDGDKLVDLADPGCANPADDDETNTIVPPVQPPVTPPVPPIEEPASAEFLIKSVTVAPEELVNGNLYTQVFIKVENETALKVEDVRGIVMIPELGVIQSTKQFAVAKNGSAMASVGLYIPAGTPSGTYLMQILVKNDSLHSVAYRQLTIVE